MGFEISERVGGAEGVMKDELHYGKCRILRFLEFDSYMLLKVRILQSTSAASVLTILFQIL